MEAPVREARAEDAAAIARVHVDAWRSTYRGIIPDAVLDGFTYESRENAWVGILRDRYKHTFVVEEDGRVVGFANGGPERSKDPAYPMELYAIYLLDAWHGRGFGRGLVRAFARRIDAPFLAWVLADNPHRAFYEALGGTPVRTKKRRIGGATLDEVAYGWSDPRSILA